MNKVAIALSVLSVLVAGIIGLSVFLKATPAGKAMWNSWFYNVQKADDATKYETRKKVEDTCRAMVSSYESDRLIYEQYNISDNKEKLNWAEQAKIRANKTASIYNNYILENSFVWEGNIPEDIKTKLEFLE